MTSRTAWRVLTPIAAALALLASVPAQAITFEQLTADGTGSGIFYAPQAGDWILAPGASETSLSNTGSGWLVGLGTSSYGIGETGSQTSTIFGAGLLLPSSTYGWRINFSANLRTWDSYNDGSVVAPNPGASLGDWDLFAVNANHQDFYWNLTAPGVSGGGENIVPTLAPAIASAAVGAGTLTDPLVPVRPAGTPTSYTNQGDPRYLPGSTWAWGGRDYAVGYFESVSTNGSVIAGGNNPTYVSFVLDTNTPDYNDTNFPSWGEFGPTGVFNNVPDGAEGEGPGGSPLNPLLPVAVSDGSFVFAPVDISEGGVGLSEFLFIDPVVAIGYEYTLAGGQSFKEILLPTLGDADGYGIELFLNGAWTLIGTVTDGGSFTFGDGVTTFRVVDIDASLNLNPDNSVAFVTGVKLDQPGIAEFTMTPITAAVPEPASWAMLLGGLAIVASLQRRKQR